MHYLQCFICREWSWDVSKVLRKDVHLCLPCYVDVLEVKQARGSMGRELSDSRETGVRRETEPGSEPATGSAPSPYVQGDLFDA